MTTSSSNAGKGSSSDLAVNGDNELNELAALRTATHRQHLDAAVDRIVEEWLGVVPSLDLDVRAIAARVARVDSRLRAKTFGVLKRAGLSDNEFRVLAGLMRIGEPHRAAPTDLAGRFVPVTSGGLTGLANRLKKRGYIRRISHPSDQRSILIELTDSGKKLAQETMEAFAEVEESMMAGLSKADRARGNAFLRKLLHSIEAALG